MWSCNTHQSSTVRQTQHQRGIPCWIRTFYWFKIDSMMSTRHENKHLVMSKRNIGYSCLLLFWESTTHQCHQARLFLLLPATSILDLAILGQKQWMPIICQSSSKICLSFLVESFQIVALYSNQQPWVNKSPNSRNAPLLSLIPRLVIIFVSSKRHLVWFWA